MEMIVSFLLHKFRRSRHQTVMSLVKGSLRTLVYVYHQRVLLIGAVDRLSKFPRGGLEKKGNVAQALVEKKENKYNSSWCIRTNIL